MALSSYQKTCYRWFGRVAENIATEKLRLNLERAHTQMRAGAYLSYVWVTTIIAGIVLGFVFFSLFIFLALPIIFVLIFILISVIGTVATYFILLNLPSSKAKARGKKIDKDLPYALNFISAMSSAGITPTEIFKALSKQRIYGEIQEEAVWIYRDVGLLGRDIISAIKSNIRRTPSDKFKEFLQGAIVTVQSGGALKPYFMSKAEQYTRENRVAQKQQIESLGIMAEAYVTSAVAGVLLIIIILPLLMIISNAGMDQINFMYIFILLVIPMIHIGFAYILSSMSTKV